MLVIQWHDGMTACEYSVCVWLCVEFPLVCRWVESPLSLVSKPASACLPDRLQFYQLSLDLGRSPAGVTRSSCSWACRSAWVQDVGDCGRSTLVGRRDATERGGGRAGGRAGASAGSPTDRLSRGWLGLTSHWLPAPPLQSTAAHHPAHVRWYRQEIRVPQALQRGTVEREWKMILSRRLGRLYLEESWCD